MKIKVTAFKCCICSRPIWTAEISDYEMRIISSIGVGKHNKKGFSVRCFICQSGGIANADKKKIEIDKEVNSVYWSDVLL